MQRSWVCVRRGISNSFHGSSNRTQRAPDRLFIYSSPVITTLEQINFKCLSTASSYCEPINCGVRLKVIHIAHFKYVCLSADLLLFVSGFKKSLGEKKREDYIFGIGRIACLRCAPRMSCQPRAEGAESWVRWAGRGVIEIIRNLSREFAVLGD